MTEAVRMNPLARLALLGLLGALFFSGTALAQPDDDDVIEVAPEDEGGPEDDADVVEVAPEDEGGPDDDVIEVAPEDEGGPEDDVIEVAPDDEGGPEDDVVEVAPDDEGGPEEGAAETEAAEIEADVAEALEFEPGADENTGIRGQVIDRATSEGLPDAPVIITGRGRERVVVADERGTYYAYLPPGTYTVISYYDGYEAIEYANVRIRRGRFTDVNVELDGGEGELDLITETYALPVSEEAIAAADANEVGAVESVAAGSGGAASAARRVAGVTTDVNGRLVVRGLAGRYTAVLLNGTQIPSTNPYVPGVNLSLFPSGLLSYLSVLKSFTPEYPGNWSGGLMLINTASYPTELEGNVSVSLGVNTLSTFQRRLDYDGGRFDWLGIDDGTRELPGSFPDIYLQPTNRFGQGSFPQDEINGFGTSLPNVWTYGRRTAMPAIGIEASVGNTITIEEDTDAGILREFGYSAMLSYDVQEVRRESTLNLQPIFEDGVWRSRSSRRQESGRLETNLAGLGTASYRWDPDNRITALTLFTLASTDQTKLQTGFDGSLGANLERWELSFSNEFLTFNQVFGEHNNLGDSSINLRWTAFANLGIATEPDRRLTSYATTGANEDVFLWQVRNSSGSRLFSRFRQRDIGGDIRAEIPLWEDGVLEVGVYASHRESSFNARRFRWKVGSNSGALTGLTGEAETILTAENAELNAIAFAEETRTGQSTELGIDSYFATLQNLSAFMLLTTPLGTDRLHLQTGARLAYVEQRLRGISPLEDFEIPDALRASRRDIDALPSAAFKFDATDELAFRLAYGMTVSRPTSRELAPFQYYDFELNRNVAGNVDLVRTRIHNIDLRGQWRFGQIADEPESRTTEMVGAGIFFKYFDSPIERAILSPTDGFTQFRNADSAYSVGVEVEGELNFGRFTPTLDGLIIDGNFAWIRSRVELGAAAGVQSQANRPLVGQSPYVANLSLRYDRDDPGYGFALNYNVFGRRIIDVGVVLSDVAFPNYVQSPFHSLNFSAYWQARDWLKLKFKVANILNETRDLTLDSIVVRRTRIGSTISVSASIDFPRTED